VQESLKTILFFKNRKKKAIKMKKKSFTKGKKIQEKKGKKK